MRKIAKFIQPVHLHVHKKPVWVKRKGLAPSAIVPPPVFPFPHPTHIVKHLLANNTKGMTSKEIFTLKPLYPAQFPTISFLKSHVFPPLLKDRVVSKKLSTDPERPRNSAGQPPFVWRLNGSPDAYMNLSEDMENELRIQRIKFKESEQQRLIAEAAAPEEQVGSAENKQVRKSAEDYVKMMQGKII